MNRFLNPEELEYLTGYKQRHLQKKALLNNGIHFFERADRSLVVTWDNVNKSNSTDKAPSAPKFESLQ